MEIAVLAAAVVAAAVLAAAVVVAAVTHIVSVGHMMMGSPFVLQLQHDA